MIIIGYQGIGKSTLAREYDGYIDLESSCFWFEDSNGKRTRWDNWAEIYAKVAIDLSKNGTVFTSSHKAVRNEIATNHGDETVICCYPDIELKEQWIQKLKVRYESTGLEKDRKALLAAEERYEEDIKCLSDYCIANNFIALCIKNVDYDLHTAIVKLLMNYYHTKKDLNK